MTIVDSKARSGGKARSYMTRPWRPGATDPQGDRELPGEHGFRFFPGFYRHLDATMRKSRSTPATAGALIDNLVEVRDELLAVTGKPGITIPAAAPSGPNLVDAFRSILQFPKDLLSVGLTREDLELFANNMAVRHQQPGPAGHRVRGGRLASVHSVARSLGRVLLVSREWVDPCPRGCQGPESLHENDRERRSPVADLHDPTQGHHRPRVERTDQ